MIRCGHKFCKECLEHWLQTQNQRRKTCPICRETLLEEDSNANPHNYPNLNNDNIDANLHDTDDTSNIDDHQPPFHSSSNFRYRGGNYDSWLPPFFLFFFFFLNHML